MRNTRLLCVLFLHVALMTRFGVMADTTSNGSAHASEREKLLNVERLRESTLTNSSFGTPPRWRYASKEAKKAWVRMELKTWFCKRDNISHYQFLLHIELGERTHAVEEMDNVQERGRTLSSGNTSRKPFGIENESSKPFQRGEITTTPQIQNVDFKFHPRLVTLSNYKFSVHEEAAHSKDEFELDGGDKSCVIIDGYPSETVDTCYEIAEKTIPILLRKEWDGEVGAMERISPVEYVVIKDGSDSCRTTKACLAKVQQEKKKTRTKPCELQENFYVGGDGNVYEGRGWKITPYWHMNGLRNKSVTFYFMGDHKNRTPSQEAIEAFEITLEMGLTLGHLSENYKIFSLRQILNDSTQLGDAIHREVMDWERWYNESSLHDIWDYSVPSRFRFVNRRHWNASSPQQKFKRLQYPIEYVVIWEGGDRCTNRTECISRIKAEQEEYITEYGDLLDNFYIGDGDEVYEGRGWNFVPHWHVPAIENKYITVRLQGSYENELPTEKAIGSLKSLVETGIWLGKISPKFKILSLRLVYSDNRLLGEALCTVVQGWTPWLKDIDSIPNLKPWISRENWNASAATTPLTPHEGPVNSIAVNAGGDRCYTFENCSLSMKKDQKAYRNPYGDLLDNFYIGDDGNIYEGRGWLILPHWCTPKNSFISVKFLGSFQTSKPSRLAVQAFDRLIKFGLKLGHINTNYTIFPIREIYNDSSSESGGLEDYLKTLTHWIGNLSSITEDERVSEGLTPFISREEWNPIKTPNDPKNVSFANVVINDLGERCFLLKGCISEMLSLQTKYSQILGEVPDNFYVGEDGRFYEGRGWNSLSYYQSKVVNSNLLFVSFLGRFQGTLPNPLAFLAFHRLMEFGTRTGKLAHDYKVFTLNELFNDYTLTGRMLSENVKTWERWSAVVPFPTVNGPSDQMIMVPSEQWNGPKTAHGRSLNTPIDQIIVWDGGDRCNSQSECISSLRDQQQRYSTNMSANFYIGEDGHVYEGRGWYYESKSILPLLNLTGIDNPRIITVSFVGKFHLDLPSAKAFEALDYLLKWGIVSEKLNPKYSLTTMKQIFTLADAPGSVLNLNTKTWKNWYGGPSNDIAKRFTPVQPGVWGNTKSIRRSNRLEHPLQFIYLSDGGDKCSDYAECVESMKNLERGDSNGILENFYIGGHGHVFEGVGWVYDTYWGFPEWKRSVSIKFLGSFETDPPSTNDFAALEMLINTGLRSRYLSPQYKIRIIPFSYKSRKWAGAKLAEKVKTWSRYNHLS